MLSDLSAVAIGTIVTVATPPTGGTYRFTGGWISVSVACSVLFEDNAAGATVFRTPILAAGVPYYFTIPTGFRLSAKDHVLKATSSVGSAITGTLFGSVE